MCEEQNVLTGWARLYRISASPLALPVEDVLFVTLAVRATRGDPLLLRAILGLPY